MMKTNPFLKKKVVPKKQSTSIIATSLDDVREYRMRGAERADYDTYLRNLKNQYEFRDYIDDNNGMYTPISCGVTMVSGLESRPSAKIQAQLILRACDELAREQFSTNYFDSADASWEEDPIPWPEDTHYQVIFSDKTRTTYSELKALSTVTWSKNPNSGNTIGVYVFQATIENIIKLFNS